LQLLVEQDFFQQLFYQWATLVDSRSKLLDKNQSHHFDIFQAFNVEFKVE